MLAVVQRSRRRKARFFRPWRRQRGWWWWLRGMATGWTTSSGWRLLNSSRSGPLRLPITDAVAGGARVFSELQNLDPAAVAPPFRAEADENFMCTQSIVLTAQEFREKGRVVELPCGLTLGSFPYHTGFVPEDATGLSGDVSCLAGTPSA